MNKRVYECLREGRFRGGRFIFGRYLIIFLLPLLPLEAVAGAMATSCTMVMGTSNTAASFANENFANEAQADQNHATAKSYSSPCHSSLCALDCLTASAATLTSKPPAVVAFYAKAVHTYLYFSASSSLFIAPPQDPPKTPL